MEFILLLRSFFRFLFYGTPYETGIRVVGNDSDDKICFMDALYYERTYIYINGTKILFRLLRGVQ